MNDNIHSFSISPLPTNDTVQPQLQSQSLNRSLKCLQINLRHSKNASLHLSQLLFDLNIDVALIQEPYAVADPLPRLKYLPDDYVELHSLTTDHAYGAAVVAKKSLQAFAFPLNTPNSVAGVKVVTKKNELYLFSIYCRPSLQNFDTFLNSFFSYLTPNIIDRSVFCFDSNARSPLWNSSILDARGRALEDSLSNHCITVENVNSNFLSHVPSKTSFIDVSGAGSYVRIMDWHFPDIPSLSDHPFILFSVNSSRSTPLSAQFPSLARKFPRLCGCSTETFLPALSESLTRFPVLDHSPTLSATEVDSYLENLLDLICSCAKKSKTSSHASNAPGKMPWWSKELWTLRDQLRKAYQHKTKFPSSDSLNKYAAVKSNYQRFLRQSKSESFKKFCSTELNDDIFKSLKKLANISTAACPSAIRTQDATITEPYSILSEFGKSFFPSDTPSTPSQLAVESSVIESLSQDVVSVTINNNTFTLMELRTAFDGLKITRTPGTDGLPAEWLKFSFDCLSNHLLHLFNACLAISYFPSKWRIAVVIILRKLNKPSYDETGSFRPISILCVLAKLFERLIHSRLKKAASSENWFNECQFGFRAGKSTESAASALVTLVENNFKKRLFTSCVFLDIKSAFDSTWPPAILSGLLRKGCPLYLVKLLQSFLLNRKANLSGLGVQITVDIELGCPQGSVLSPFLWNVLIDHVLDFTYPFPCKVIAYADDLVLCAYDRDPTVATFNLQTMCDATVLWGTSVKLGFNASKTSFLIFTRNKQAIPNLQVIINNIPINRTNKCTYLGLIIDDHLTWKEHITAKCLASRRLLFIINKCCRLTWGISRRSLSTLYKTIFIPKIIYGCAVWGGATKFKWCVKALHTAQRPFVLAISRSFKSTSTLAATFLADVLPLELEIKKMVARRLISTSTSSHASPSSASLVTTLVNKTASANTSSKTPIQQVKRAITKSIYEEWDQKWKHAQVAEQTRRFFPSIPPPSTLSNLNPSMHLTQILTGHCFLNSFLAKIGKSETSMCHCQGDVETVEHFLFSCPIYDRLRIPFKSTAALLGLSWPPDESSIAGEKSLWNEMSKFVTGTKRLQVSSIFPS